MSSLKGVLLFAPWAVRNMCDDHREVNLLRTYSYLNVQIADFVPVTMSREMGEASGRNPC